MSIIKKMRKQTCVWWARGDVDKYGRATYASPVELACRWDDAGAEFRNTVGAIEMSEATVYPDQICGVGDMMKKGDLDSLTLDDPTEDIAAFEIRRFDQTPNLRATETLFTAHLTKHFRG